MDILGGETVTGLIRALQHELGTSMDGIFGNGTANLFNNLYPNGLSINTQNQNNNINYIINGGFFCRGIDPGSFSSSYNQGTKMAVETLQEQIGLSTQNGITDAKILRAILTTDAYTLVSSGDINIRIIQRSLNNKYGSYFQRYIPTNGLYERYTNNGIIIAIQTEIGVETDGVWGNNTKNNCPTLMVGSTNSDMIYLLQYLLYANGFNPNGFDGGFGNGVRNAVIGFQTLMCLDADGICGKQTWSALVVSCGDTSRSANACDTCFEITQSRAQMLKNNGFDVVGRYLTGYISPTRPKALATGELQTILDANLKAFVIYQDNNTNINDFNRKEGIKAAIQASNAANKNKLPENTIIYFAVDLDVYEDEIDTHIIPYFKGVKNYLSARYKVGIYGPRLACKKVSALGYAESSFVSDMSYGYSCNIGQTIPSNWNYDQFVEISGYNNDLDIDKVTFRGQVQPISQLDYNASGLVPNEKNIQYIKNIYDLAEEYYANTGTIQEINKLVLQYLAIKEYNNLAWNTLVSYDSSGISYIQSRIGIDDRSNVSIYIPHFDKSITLPHLAISTYMILNQATQIPAINACVADLCGWAGDLLQFCNSINNNYGQGTLPDNLDDIVEAIIGSEYSNTFSLEDLLQDFIAWDIYYSLNSLPIYTILSSYFYSSTHNSINEFLTKRIMYGNIPSQINMNSSAYDKIYYLSKQYLDTDMTQISGIMATIFNQVLFYNPGSQELRDAVARGFAAKISSMV